MPDPTTVTDKSNDLQHTQFPHPFPYLGSKRKQSSFILSYFPSRFNRLIEPFAGSAAISIAVATRKLTRDFWLNDANVPLMRLWKVLLFDPPGLAGSYNDRWNAQFRDPTTFYAAIQDRFNLHRMSADLFFLLYRSANSIVSYNDIGEFTNTPRPGKLGAKPSVVEKRITEISQLLIGKTVLTSLDYRTVLPNSERGDFVYIDPPYHDPHKSGKYASSIDHTEFCDHLARLNNRKIMYAVSYGSRERDKKYGISLPSSLGLMHVNVDVGRSNQSAITGIEASANESLYISRAAASKLGSLPHCV